MNDGGLQFADICQFITRDLNMRLLASFFSVSFISPLELPLIKDLKLRLLLYLGN
jgi:hypothetical protein